MELQNGSGGGGSAITITEQDGSPSGTLSLLKVTNGTLIDNGGGTFSLTTGGGGGSGISSINGDTTADQTLIATSAGTNFTITDNLTGQHSFNLPVATASVTGKLSSTDWTTFNNKGSGTVISVSGTTDRITVTGTTSAIIDIAATYVGQTSITTVGTIATGTWSATTIALNKGGTGQTTKAAAFDALSPMTTGGDIIYGGASGTGTRLANGSNGQVLTSSGTTAAPTWATPTTGTVTAVSVVTVNGFAGSSSGGTTPALTISTTTSGILKGNGTAISAATAGVDYTALAFKTIAISGSSDVIATSAADTLTLVAGSGVTVTGTSSSRSITISATGGGSGTVTSVSVVTANGFAGSVATATTTPAITLTVTTSGILTGGPGGVLIAATTTGTGNVVLQTSPTLITPILGVATATTINKVTITAATTGSTLSILDGKTLTVLNTITFSGTDSVAMNVSNNKIASIGITIDGGGSAITTGIKGDIFIPYDATINSVTMLADQSGSIVVDIWKDTYANYPPTVADTITASAKPTISTATNSQDTTLTGWTTAVTAGNTLRFNVDSATTITRLNLVLKVTKT